MFERDYIMRIVQQFSKMIAHIIGLKEKGKYEEALKEIKDVYGSTLKLGYEEITGFEYNDWNRFYSERSVEELEMVSDLLRLEGEVLLEMGRPDGVCSKLFLALDLLKHVNESEKNFSLDRMSKIVGLEDKLAGADNDPL